MVTGVRRLIWPLTQLPQQDSATPQKRLHRLRNASSREKKRVYSLVLKNASKRQNDLVEQAEKESHASSDGTCALV